MLLVPIEDEDADCPHQSAATAFEGGCRIVLHHHQSSKSDIERHTENGELEQD
jgi:hypothetical protein